MMEYHNELLDRNDYLERQLDIVEQDKTAFKKCSLQLLTSIIDVLKDKSLSTTSHKLLEEAIHKAAKTIYR